MRIAGNLLLFIITIAATLLHSGCSRLPITGQLPQNLEARRLAGIDPDSPMAISPDGKVAAVSSSGLKLLHLPSGQLLEVDGRLPGRVAWSPGGYGLAASFSAGGGSSIVTYDQHGIRVAEERVEGKITDLAWLSEGEILAASISITNYKFGSNYATRLHRWSPGMGGVATVGLRQTTLQPATIRQWLPLLQRGPMLDLSPDRRVILYLQPMDPPLFNPKYKLVLRDLASGREMEVDNLPWSSDGGRFSADGELLFHGDGGGKTTLRDPWSGEIVATLPGSGRNLELSPVGDYRFSDGTLYRNDSLVAPLAEGGRAIFSPNGRELLVSAGADLYLVTGLRPEGSRLLTPPQREKLLQPRSWRLEGLISPNEYRETLERIKRQ